MITLLSIEGEVLQLLLVLPVVQYGLWEDDILIDLSVEVSESGPLLGVDLHDIEHHAVFHLLLGVKKILHLHLLVEFALLPLQVSDLLLRV